MKTIVHDGKLFKQAMPGGAAIRCIQKGFWEVVEYLPNGEITCKAEPVTPDMYNNLKSLFEEEAIEMNNFNLVSPCCHSGIGSGSKMEYPLNDGYGMSYKVDVCEECGREVENPVEQCMACGEVECRGECEAGEASVSEISPYPAW